MKSRGCTGNTSKHCNRLEVSGSIPGETFKFISY